MRLHALMLMGLLGFVLRRGLGGWGYWNCSHPPRAHVVDSGPASVPLAAANASHTSRALAATRRKRTAGSALPAA
jgi:hypothetical protein